MTFHLHLKQRGSPTLDGHLHAKYEQYMNTHRPGSLTIILLKIYLQGCDLLWPHITTVDLHKKNDKDHKLNMTIKYA